MHQKQDQEKIEIVDVSRAWVADGGWQPYKVRRKPNGHFLAIKVSRLLILTKKIYIYIYILFWVVFLGRISLSFL